MTSRRSMAQQRTTPDKKSHDLTKEKNVIQEGWTTSLTGVEDVSWYKVL